MPYRFEIAKQSRAACKSTDCKAAGSKIAKGELRFGSLVTISDRESWSWKHWGCVTPAQIENLLKSIDGFEAFEKDHDRIDGFDEVDEESQLKIRTALEEGHVPDEDWKGDPEYNRPGARGMHKRTLKKKKDEENEGEEEAGEAELSPSNEKPPKSRKSKAAESDDQAADASPAPKANAARKRKTATEDHVSTTDTKPAKKPRSRKAKQQKTPEDDSEPEVMPTKKQRGKKAEHADQTDGGAGDVKAEVPQPAAKPSRAKKANNDKAGKDAPKSTILEPDPEGAKPARKARGKKAQGQEEAVTKAAETTTAKASRVRIKQTAKPAVSEEDRAQEVGPAEEEANLSASGRERKEEAREEPVKEKVVAKRGGRKKAAAKA